MEASLFFLNRDQRLTESEERQGRQREVDDPYAGRVRLPKLLLAIAAVTIEPDDKARLLVLDVLVSGIRWRRLLVLRLAIQAGRLQHALARGIHLLVDVGTVPGEPMRAPPDERHESRVDGPADALHRASFGVLDEGLQRQENGDCQRDAVKAGPLVPLLHRDAGNEHHGE